jgi:hypothetical protein
VNKKLTIETLAKIVKGLGVKRGQFNNFNKINYAKNK